MARSFHDFEIERLSSLVENSSDSSEGKKNNFFFKNNIILDYTELQPANQKVKNSYHYTKNWIIVPKSARYVILVSYFLLSKI